MSQAAKNEINGLIESAKGFAKESVGFINRCTKPDKRGNKFF